MESAVFNLISSYVQLLSGCTISTIRLVGGRSSNEGRVEICINGVWGTVCDDNWDSSDARVVCRQLGLPYDAGAIIEFLSIVEQWLNLHLNLKHLYGLISLIGALAYSNAYFSSGSGPYYLDDVHCSGSESSLLSCSRGYSEIGVHNCRPGNEAGVKCVTGE